MLIRIPKVEDQPLRMTATFLLLHRVGDSFARRLIEAVRLQPFPGIHFQPRLHESGTSVRKIQSIIQRKPGENHLTVELGTRLTDSAHLLLRDWGSRRESFEVEVLTEMPSAIPRILGSGYGLPSCAHRLDKRAALYTEGMHVHGYIHAVQLIVASVTRM